MNHQFVETTKNKNALDVDPVGDFTLPRITSDILAHHSPDSRGARDLVQYGPKTRLNMEDSTFILEQNEDKSYTLKQFSTEEMQDYETAVYNYNNNQSISEIPQHPEPLALAQFGADGTVYYKDDTLGGLDYVASLFDRNLP